MVIQVDAPAEETHAFGAKAPALHQGPATEAGGDPPSGAHHPVPGDGALAGPGQGSKRPAYGPGPPRDTQERCDLTVGGDAAPRDLLDQVVDPIEEALVTPHWGGGGVSVESGLGLLGGATRSGRA